MGRCVRMCLWWLFFGTIYCLRPLPVIIVNGLVEWNRPKRVPIFFTIHSANVNSFCGGGQTSEMLKGRGIARTSNGCHFWFWHIFIGRSSLFQCFALHKREEKHIHRNTSHQSGILFELELEIAPQNINVQLHVYVLEFLFTFWVKHTLIGIHIRIDLWR